MRIQKKYQGAIPLNRIANEHNESDINTYSTNYLNNTFIPKEEVGDYVVERGENYRKWASGVAEAWGACYEYANPMVGTSVGNIYRCTTPLQINLPAGVFVDTPNISTDLRYCTVVSWVGTLEYENNATQIRSKYIMSPVNLSNRTVEYYVDWYAIGKWK